MVGIKKFGAYLPQRRLIRSSIASANAWFEPSLSSLSRGERTMSSWDEDSITMAVEAARDMGNLESITQIILASTTHPFSIRQNSVIAAEALNLKTSVRSADVGGSLRSSTSAILSGLDSSRANSEDTLILTSDKRVALAGSPTEMLSGDGAAGVVVGKNNVIASYLGSSSLSADFVDQFRASNERYDYLWEDRWVREEGWLKLIPPTISKALEKSDVDPSKVDHLIIPSQFPRVAEKIAKICGIEEKALCETLMNEVGQCGTAHPAILLSLVLSSAKPNQIIVAIGFGQGCDVLVFKTTNEINNYKPLTGVEGWLANRVEETNYDKFLTFNNLIQRDLGKRAELDRPPALTAQFRNREGVTGFRGGRCKKCETIQYPKSIYCVNPECRAKDSQGDYPFSELKGYVKTFTADHLVFSIDPPSYFGLVEFIGGGRMMVEFADVNNSDFDVGKAVKMRFRIKHLDDRRNTRQYFWKACPVKE